MLDTLLKDLRYAVRTLTTSPGFALVAVLSLAAGIGINTAMFSIVNAILLRPLPVERPDQLVSVYTTSDIPESSSSYLDYRDLRDANSTLTGLAGHTLMFANVSEGGQSRIALGEIVTANYFDVLGVKPSIGRAFQAGDDGAEGGNRLAVISEGLWRRQFGGAPDAIGRAIQIRGVDYTVIGVMPASFTGMTPGLQPELWIPVSMVADVEPVGMNDNVPSPTGTSRITRRGQRWLFLKGRLKLGVTSAQAQADLDGIMTRLRQEYPQTNKDRSAVVVPAGSVRIHPAIDGALVPGAAALMAAVGLVLVIACANIANMLLARASARTREMAIRLAIGASRIRVVRQLLVESLMLAVAGGWLGVLLARWAIGLLVSFQPPIPIPIALDIDLDGRVLVFTTVVTLVTGVLFGLAPALQATRPNLVPALKNDPAAESERRRRIAMRDVLVVVQVTTSVVLMIAAGLLVRGVTAARATDVGFRPEGIAIATVDLQMHRYTPERGREFYRQALDRLRAVPGVTAVALTDRLPFSPNINTSSIFIDGRAYGPNDRPITIDSSTVSAGYFKTLDVPFIEGRDFDARDTETSPGVIVVNQAMARRFWPDQSAIGRRIHLITPGGRPYEVVGVVRDHKVRTIGEAPRPLIVFARSQQPALYGTLVVRGSGDARQLSQVIRRELQALEPGLVFLENEPMTSAIATTLFPARAAAALLGAFGSLALLLSGLGLYGVIAFSVSRRTREIGIRMALGANRRGVVTLVMRQGLGLTAIGLLAGMALAAVLTRALAGALYGVPSLDAVTYAATTGVLLAVACLANAIPARRAASVDPMIALRTN